MTYGREFYDDYKCLKHTTTNYSAYTLKGKLMKEDLYDDRTGWTCYRIDNSIPLKSINAFYTQETFTSSVYDLQEDKAYKVDVFRRNETSAEFTITLSIDDNPAKDSIGYYTSTSFSIRVVEEDGKKKLSMRAKLRGFGSSVTVTSYESNTEKKHTETKTRDDVSYDLEFTGVAEVPSKGIFWYHE